MSTHPVTPDHNFYLTRYYETNEPAVIPRTWILKLHKGAAYVAIPAEITRRLVEYSGPHRMDWKQTYVQVDEGFETSTEAYEYLNRINIESEAVEGMSEQPYELARLLTNAQTPIKKSHENSIQLESNFNPNVIILGKSPQKSPENQKKKKEIPGLLPLSNQKQPEAEYLNPIQNVPFCSQTVTDEGGDNASPKPSTSKTLTMNNKQQELITNENPVKEVDEKRKPKEAETDVSTQEISKTIQNERIYGNLSSNVFSGSAENNEYIEEVGHIKTLDAAKNYLLKMHTMLSRKNPHVPLVSCTPGKPNVKLQENVKTYNYSPLVNKINHLPQTLSNVKLSEHPTTSTDSDVYNDLTHQKQQNLSKIKIHLLKSLRELLKNNNACLEDLKLSRHHSSSFVKEMLQTIKTTRELMTNSLNSTSSEKVKNKLGTAEDFAETNQNKPVPKLHIASHLKVENTWTLKYANPIPGKTIQLVPGSQIYVDKNGLDTCKRRAHNMKDLAVFLLHQIFTNHALKHCSMTGKKRDSFRKCLPGLCSRGIQALLDFVTLFSARERAGQVGWEVNGKSLKNCVSNYITRYHDK